MYHHSKQDAASALESGQFFWFYHLFGASHKQWLYIFFTYPKWRNEFVLSDIMINLVYSRPWRRPTVALLFSNAVKGVLTSNTVQVIKVLGLYPFKGVQRTSTSSNHDIQQNFVSLREIKVPKKLISNSNSFTQNMNQNLVNCSFLINSWFVA